MASSSCGSRRFPPPWSAEETDAFCFRGIRLRRLERDFPGNSMHLGFAPLFLRPLYFVYRVINATPSIVRPAKFRLSSLAAVQGTGATFSQKAKPPLTIP